MLKCKEIVTEDGTPLHWGPFALTTNATCPNNMVLRDPYPRALVNVRTNFELLLDEQYKYGPSKAGNWSPEVSPENIEDENLKDKDGAPKFEGMRRNVRIGLRAKRLEAGEMWFGYQAITPTWTFNSGLNGERAWNNSKGGDLVQKNVTATFTYETSSYGLATGGREFDSGTKKILNTYNLSAYQVQLETACGFEWSMSWELSVKDRIVKTDEAAPCWLPDEAHKAPPIAASEGCPPGQVADGKWKYKWESRISSDCGDGIEAIEGWCGQDMKKYGLLDKPFAIRKITTEGGIFKGDKYWSPAGAGIRVPVVEVQTVMREQCVAENSCSAPVASSASLVP